MKTLIAGIGSTIRRDDGIGVHVLDRLRELDLGPDVELCELGTGGLALIDRLDGHSRLIVIDAIQSGAPPGTIVELSGSGMARAVHLASGHEADLPATLEVARQLLDRPLPGDDSVVVVAIEAADICTFSEQLSEPVAAAIPAAVERVLQILKQQ